MTIRGQAMVAVRRWSAPRRSFRALLLLLGAIGSPWTPGASAQEGEGQSDPGLLLRPGSKVRVEQDSLSMTGILRRPFTLDSASLVLCGASACAGSEPDVLVVPLSEIRRLDVWGARTGVGTYAGIYGGMLAVILAFRPEEGVEPLAILGGVFGGAIGGFLGSRWNGWVRVFPCYHGCATGVYPDRASQ